jgi:hypothetical protein
MCRKQIAAFWHSVAYLVATVGLWEVIPLVIINYLDESKPSRRHTYWDRWEASGGIFVSPGKQPNPRSDCAMELQRFVGTRESATFHS